MDNLPQLPTIQNRQNNSRINFIVDNRTASSVKLKFSPILFFHNIKQKFSSFFRGKNPLWFGKRIIAISFLILVVLGFKYILTYYLEKPAFDNFRITNLSSNSFTLTWTSDDPKDSEVYISEKGNSWIDAPIIDKANKQIFYDDRDVRQTESGYVLNQSQKRFTHHVTVRGLESEKEYEFRIKGDNRLFSIDDSTVKTLKQIESLKAPDPVYEKIYHENENFDLPNEGIIYYKLIDSSNKDLSQTYSTFVNNNGAWAGDIALIRDSAGDFAKVNKANSQIEITTLTDEYKDVSKYSLQQYQPLPDLYLDIAQKRTSESNEVKVDTTAQSQTDPITGETIIQTASVIVLQRDCVGKICGAGTCDDGPNPYNGGHYCKCYNGTTIDGTFGATCPGTVTPPPSGSCKCTGGTSNTGQTGIQANQNTTNAVCGADNQYYNCTSSCTWQSTGIRCTGTTTTTPTPTRIPTPPPTQLPVTPSMQNLCTGQCRVKEKNSTLRSQSSYPLNTSCYGVDNKCYVCVNINNKASFQTISDSVCNAALNITPTPTVAPNCANAGDSYLGKSCCAGLNKCTGGVDAGTCQVSCRNTITKTPTQPPANNSCAGKCRLYGKDSILMSEDSYASGTKCYGIDNRCYSCNNGTFGTVSDSICNDALKLTVTPTPATCTAYGQSGTAPCCSNLMKCTTGANANKCYTKSICEPTTPTPTLTPTPTVTPQQRDSANTCIWGTFKDIGTPTDGKWRCECQYGNDGEKACLPPSTNEQVNIKLTNVNPAAINQVVVMYNKNEGGVAREKRIDLTLYSNLQDYIRLRGNNFSGENRDTGLVVLEFVDTSVIIEVRSNEIVFKLKNVLQMNRNIRVNLLKKQGAVCSQEQYAYSQLVPKDTNPNNVKEINIQLGCIISQDVVVQDPVNTQTKDLEPMDPNYQDVDINIAPQNYLQFIQKAVAILNKYDNKPKIPWWMITSVLTQESSFHCNSSMTEVVECNKMGPNGLDPNQAGLQFLSPDGYGSVGVGQFRKVTFESILNNSYWWRAGSATASNTGAMLDACMDGLGVDRNINREDSFANITSTIDPIYLSRYSRVRIADSVCATAIAYAENAAGPALARNIRNWTGTYINPNQWGKFHLRKAFAHYFGIEDPNRCIAGSIDEYPDCTKFTDKYYLYSNECRKNNLLCGVRVQGPSADFIQYDFKDLNLNKNIFSIAKAQGTDNQEGVTLVSDTRVSLEPGTYSVKKVTDDLIFEDRIINVPDYSTNYLYEIYLDSNTNGIKDADEQLVELTAAVVIEKISDTYSYELNKGWNLVSFPFSPTEITKASQLIDLLNTKGSLIKAIAKYEGGKFVIFNKLEGESYGDDFEINPYQGYFILSDSIGNIDIEGTASSINSIALANGWNLIGVNSESTALEILNKCKQAQIECDSIARHDGSNYEIFIKEDNDVFGNDYNVFIKSGYFIRVKSGGGNKLNF